MTQDLTHPEEPGDPRWEAVGRYLSGESNADETAVVRARLASSPSDAALVAALEKSTARDAPTGIDVEAALQRVRGRLDEAQVIPLRPRVIAWAGRPRSWGVAAAAAAVLLTGGALFISRGTAPAGDVAGLVLSTGVGERDSLRLTDGTVIVLGPVSAVEILADDANSREVFLRGEGYFDVPHDESRPFVVRTSTAVIRDLGTRFAVRSGDTLRVTVTDGAVSLQSLHTQGDTGILLHAGDAGTLTPDGQTHARRGVASDDDIAWTRGTLVFRDAPLSDVRDVLRRWYGVEVVVDEALLGRHLTATFASEPIERVLEIVALTLGARVEQRADTAIIRPPR